MARKRRKSIILEKAQRRANNLWSISATLDLGPGLTLAEFKQKIDRVYNKQERYNTALATLDELLNDLQADEKIFDDLNARMLAGVGARWGKNSNEYEQAGGTRTDERKNQAAVINRPKANNTLTTNKSMPNSLTTRWTMSSKACCSSSISFSAADSEHAHKRKFTSRDV
ncbi:MAG TPA: hypothetical protein VF658_07310 [Pyrinomonadaceae bacterium]|jgi:hypothetical protein